MIEIGQRVVCISDVTLNGRFSYGDCKLPHVGCVYTIRGVGLHGCGIVLEEIINNIQSCYCPSTSWVGKAEPDFFYGCFRPVKKTDISVFQKLLAPTPSPTKVNV